MQNVHFFNWKFAEMKLAKNLLFVDKLKCIMMLTFFKI